MSEANDMLEGYREAGPEELICSGDKCFSHYDRSWSDISGGWFGRKVQKVIDMGYRVVKINDSRNMNDDIIVSTLKDVVIKLSAHKAFNPDSALKLVNIIKDKKLFIPDSVFSKFGMGIVYFSIDEGKYRYVYLLKD